VELNEPGYADRNVKFNLHCGACVSAGALLLRNQFNGRLRKLRTKTQPRQRIPYAFYVATSVSACKIRHAYNQMLW